MSAPLSESERELISAYVDDEVTDDERRQVEAMLEREDAAEYLYEIRATRELAIEHARVPAPVGLKSRVMQKLKTRNAPPPAFQWSTAVYAAAAVLVVTLGIMFGPMLLGPGDDTMPTVAREDLEEFRAVENTEEPLEKLQVDAGAESEAPRESEFARTAGKEESVQAEAEPEEDEELLRNEERVLRGRRGAGQEGGADRSAAADDEAPKDAAESLDADAAPSARASRTGIGGGVEAGENTEIVIDAAGPAAENDVVWVSSLHGDVEFGDDAQGEYLSVAVDPEGVAGFRKALSNLARDQGYGAGTLADRRGADITDYLPTDEWQPGLRDDRNDAPVRVIVRLK